MPVDLRPLLPYLPSWLLVLFRLTGIFVLAPVLGSTAVPRMVKVYLALGLSLAVYPMLLNTHTLAPPGVAAVMNHGLSLWSLGAAISTELLIGFVIGYAATLPLVAMQIGGQMIDQQMGLSIGGVYNPDLGAQGGLTGQFLFVLATAIFVIMGGHEVLFTILVGSFHRIPLGGLHQALGIGQIVDLVLAVLHITFEMALRVAAPLLCLIFLLTVAMGFLARTVPQINVLSIGFVVRIVAGVGFLILTLHSGVMVYVWALKLVLHRLMGFFAM